MPRMVFLCLLLAMCSLMRDIRAGGEHPGAANPVQLALKALADQPSIRSQWRRAVDRIDVTPTSKDSDHSSATELAALAQWKQLARMALDRSPLLPAGPMTFDDGAEKRLEHIKALEELPEPDRLILRFGALLDRAVRVSRAAAATWPEDDRAVAAKLVLELADNRFQSRERLVRLLGTEKPDPALLSIAAVTAAATDESADSATRTTALVALDRWGAAALVAADHVRAVLGAERTTPIVRLSAALALISMTSPRGDREAFQYIEDALGDGSMSHLLIVMERLRKQRFRLPQSLLKKVAAFLSDRRPVGTFGHMSKDENPDAICWIAAEALERQAPGSIPTLRAAAAESNTHGVFVSTMALVGLGLRPERSSKHILGALRSSSNYVVTRGLRGIRQSAATCNAEILDALSAVLRGRPNLAVAAAQSLLDCGNASDRLARVLTAADYPAWSVVRALAQRRHHVSQFRAQLRKLGGGSGKMAQLARELVGE